MSKFQNYLNYIADPRARRSLRGILSEFLNDDVSMTFKPIVFGAGATPISLTGAFTTGISIAADGTTGISITSAFSGVNMISLAGTGSTSGILISGACAASISVTGNATDVLKTATGTFTDVIDIGGTVTNAINFNAVGIGIALHFIDAFAGKVIETGSYASAEDKGVLLNATNSRPASFLFDDGGTAFANDADIRPLLARTYFGATNQLGTGIRFASMRGHIKVPTGTTLGGDTSEWYAAQGILECAGTLTVGAGAFAAAVCGMLWCDGNLTSTGLSAGVMAKINQTAGTSGAKTAAFLATKWWNSAVPWSIGLYIPAGAATLPISVGDFASAVAGSGITLSAAVTAAVRVYADDGGAKLAAGEKRVMITRFLFATADTDQTDQTMSAHVGQVKVAQNLTINGNVAGLCGYLEVAAGITLIGGRMAQASVAAGVWGRVDVPATAVVGTAAYVSAFAAGGNLGGTHTGTLSVLHVPNPAAGVWDAFASFDDTTGCTVANALVPAAAPDASTMGADLAIKIIHDGTAYYIPAYNSLHA